MIHYNIVNHGSSCDVLLKATTLQTLIDSFNSTLDNTVMFMLSYRLTLHIGVRQITQTPRRCSQELAKLVHPGVIYDGIDSRSYSQAQVHVQRQVALHCSVEVGSRPSEDGGYQHAQHLKGVDYVWRRNGDVSHGKHHHRHGRVDAGLYQALQIPKSVSHA